MCDCSEIKTVVEKSAVYTVVENIVGKDKKKDKMKMIEKPLIFAGSSYVYEYFLKDMIPGDKLGKSAYILGVITALKMVRGKKMKVPELLAEAAGIAAAEYGLEMI